jgi:chaperonin GroES
MTILKPMHDRVVIKRVDSNKTTAAGIVIPQTAQEKNGTARVVAVGPGKYVDGKLIPMSLKEGDLVLIPKYAGAEVTIDGEAMVILREEEVLSKITTN